MPTYKGNVGNLMQHWTFCELVRIAQDSGVPGLNFIDAHAMAPLAMTKNGADGRFNRAEDRVQRDHEPDHQWTSEYERAWHRLAPRGGYPNSSNFVRQVWTCEFSMLLCENNGPTIEELGPWCGQMNDLPRCAGAELFPGNWRKRFEQPRGIPSPGDVGLPNRSLTLISFDPDMISYRARPDQPNHQQHRMVYPQDLQEVRNQLVNFDGGILIYLPTYSAQNNPQPQVIDALDAILTPNPDGFTRTAKVRVNGHMMALVYARGLDDWAVQLAELPGRFTDWLGQV